MKRSPSIPPVALSATETVASNLVQQFADHDLQRIAIARVNAVAQQQFDGSADFGQQRVGLGFRLAARAQMDLDVAVRRPGWWSTGFSYFL